MLEITLFKKIPFDCQNKIFTLLSVKDLCLSQRISKNWKLFIENNDWMQIYFSKYGCAMTHLVSQAISEKEISWLKALTVYQPIIDFFFQIHGYQGKFNNSFLSYALTCHSTEYTFVYMAKQTSRLTSSIEIFNRSTKKKIREINFLYKDFLPQTSQVLFNLRICVIFNRHFLGYYNNEIVVCDLLSAAPKTRPFSNVFDNKSTLSFSNKIFSQILKQLKEK